MKRNLILWVPYLALAVGVASVYSSDITGDLMLLIGWLLITASVAFGALSSAILAMRGRAVALIWLAIWIGILTFGGLGLGSAYERAKSVAQQGEKP